MPKDLPIVEFHAAASSPQHDSQNAHRGNLQCANRNCASHSLMRRFLKRRTAGVFLQGRWYCSVDCFQMAIVPAIGELLKPAKDPAPARHRVPLGLLLLGRGIITEAQLKHALQAQRDSGGERVGQWLLRFGSATHHDLALALATQWGCPVFPLERDRSYRECSSMLPLAMLESLQMLPVHYLSSSRLLYIAFAQHLDRTSLIAVERLLGDRTVACVVPEAHMEVALSEIKGAARPSEVVFETLRDATEMAYTIREYSLKIGAEELRLARPNGFLWSRLIAGGRAWDLLFRLPESAHG